MNEYLTELFESVEAGEITAEDASELYEIFSDTVCDELVTENLETNILKKQKFGSKMTLYHGSTIKITNEIKPKSLNMGTRLSRMRMSSFWTPEKESAIFWGIESWLFSNAYDIYSISSINTTDNKVYSPSHVIDGRTHKKVEFKPIVKSILKNIKIYVYTIKDIPVKDIGAGQLNIGELTIDKPIAPDKMEVLELNDVMKYFVFTSYEEVSAKHDKLIGKGNNSIAEKLIYRDPVSTMRKRSEIYKKSKHLYDNGKGKGKMDEDGTFIPI